MYSNHTRLSAVPIVIASWSLSHYACRLAPPDSMASISAGVHDRRWKRAGSSERSKYSPLAASTRPSEVPGAPPIWPPTILSPGFKGPCCWAFFLYEANDSGSASFGEAGCTWGVWSTSAMRLLVIKACHVCQQSHTRRDAAPAQKADHGLATLLQYLGCVHCG
jgi:hypothetical protein